MATILILDDRATNRNIYARLAAAIEDGVSAEVFADPTDALEWLESNRVDLVITDYKMPGMDGAEFTRRFRAMPNNRHVPLVVITAYDDRSFRLRALDAGATDFLQSPVDHFEIVVRARNLLALGRRMAPSDAARVLRPGPADRTAAADPWRLLDALPARVSVVDREGRCIYLNAACAAAAGEAPDALLGAGAAKLYGPERAERGRAQDVAVFAAGRPAGPYRDDTPAAAGRGPVLTSKAPLLDQDGGVAAVVTVSVDLPSGGAAEHRDDAGPAPRNPAG